jgi:hypothetical protein
MKNGPPVVTYDDDSERRALVACAGIKRVQL